ncbi:MAG: hypothetical protein OEX02_15975 [Cyclobacteriaceae bacterium]|nr:hypothetical protein [Cyclobacteriaceae bacterium]
MNIQIDEKTYEEIAAIISSDASPVGIDAKKTHILILKMLMDINDRLEKLEQKTR